MEEIVLLRKILTKLDRIDDQMARDRARETLYEQNVIKLLVIIGNRMTYIGLAIIVIMVIALLVVVL